jgi:hypothetical protein
MDKRYNINDRNFFSDENINEIAVDAEYADWAPGPNESPGAVSKPRPAGDSSQLHYDEIEHDRSLKG